jgi:hypothetical protein
MERTVPPRLDKDKDQDNEASRAPQGPPRLVLPCDGEACLVA